MILFTFTHVTCIDFGLQRAKVVLFDNPGPLDFAIALVNPVLNLPEGQVKVLWGNSNYRRTVINVAHKNFFGAT